jgi:hypothetical protein
LLWKKNTQAASARMGIVGRSRSTRQPGHRERNQRLQTRDRLRPFPGGVAPSETGDLRLRSELNGGRASRGSR